MLRTIQRLFQAMSKEERVAFVLSATLTFAIGGLQLLRLFEAGGLWRDEAAALQLATLPQAQDIFREFPHEAFPPPFFFLIRSWTAVFGTGDIGLRLYGLLIGLCITAALWWVTWTVRRSVPLISLALIGFNGAFLMWGTEVRGYGLAVCCIVVFIALLWRLIERPTNGRAAAAMVGALCATQFLLHNLVLLAVLCAAGIFQSWRQEKIRPVAIIILIGLIAAACLVPYLGRLNSAREWDVIVRTPGVWENMQVKLGEALGGSGWWNVPFWGILFLTTAFVFVLGYLQPRVLKLDAHRSNRIASTSFRGRGRTIGRSEAHVAGARNTPSRSKAGDSDARTSEPRRTSKSQDVLLFSGSILLLGTAVYFTFLFALQYPTQAWYYLSLLAISAVSIDLAWASLKHLKWARYARIWVAVIVAIGSLWPTFRAARTRMTNIDLIARRLEASATKEDLVIVMPWQLGISFNRYYHGVAPWMTVPPIQSHAFHRYDLVKPLMVMPDQNEPIRPVFDKIGEALDKRRRVWVVTLLEATKPVDALPELVAAPNGQYGWNEQTHTGAWCIRVLAYIQGRSAGSEAVKVNAGGPVNPFEDLRVTLFRGAP
jgi:hypothetical protein